MVSVIIPAHNESNSIERCLRALTDGAAPGELEVLVVCNGCSDDTADRARRAGGPVTVLEIGPPSKIAALNLGDRNATGFPRFYVDADVILRLGDLRRVAEVLRRGETLAAAPRIDVILNDRGWAVRAFYRTWMSLPYFASGMIGSGVYAVSEEGRSRFTTFPNILADDNYVRLQFRPDERRTIDDAVFQIIPPRSISGLIHIKTRTHKGNRQLRQLYPELMRNDARPGKSAFLTFLAYPRRWPGFILYAFIMGSAKLIAHWKLRRGQTDYWERDDESRSPADSGHPRAEAHRQ